MLIPINTDAPVYHYPYSTLGLMVANCLVFVLTGTGDFTNEFTKQLSVNFAAGMRPHEWFTSLFVHYGYMHLIGNMIFLWGFGLVVEGKLGWWRYILVYLAIGGIVSAIEQGLMLNADISKGPVMGGGASGVIFGLLGISLIWAPKNEMMCMLIVRGFMFIDIAILWFAFFYIVWELIWMIFWSMLVGFQMSSQFVHFTGGIVGIIFGVAFVLLKWVDCENWDLLAVMAGTHGSTESAEQLKMRKAANFKGMQPRPLDEIVEGAPPPDRVLTRPLGATNRTDSLDRIRRFLRKKKATAAFAEYRTMRHFHPDWKLDEPELRALVNGLYRARDWTNVIPCMDEYISRFPGRCDRIRLKRAALAVEIEKRPRYAVKLVDQIRTETLEVEDLKQIERIRAAAKKLVASGELELGETG